MRFLVVDNDFKACLLMRKAFEPYGLNEAVPKAITKAITKSVPEAITKAITKAVPEAITKAVTEAITKAVTEAITKAVIEAVTDGGKYIEAFHSSLKNNRPFDLITPDILMPCLNDHEALREIGEIEREEGVKLCNKAHIIMVSGSQNSKEFNDAYFLGAATAYIEKGIDKTVLSNKISIFGIKLEIPKTS